MWGALNINSNCSGEEITDGSSCIFHIFLLDSLHFSPSLCTIAFAWTLFLCPAPWSNICFSLRIELTGIFSGKPSLIVSVLRSTRTSPKWPCATASRSPLPRSVCPAGREPSKGGPPYSCCISSTQSPVQQSHSMNFVEYMGMN